MACTDREHEHPVSKRNHGKCRNDPKCRKCHSARESMEHIVSSCHAMKLLCIIPRHNIVVKVILKEMLKFHRIPYKPGAVYQSDTIEILHEARIDNALTKTNKPDLIVKNRTNQKSSKYHENNIVKRSRDKIEKYQPLAAALKKSNPDHNVAVIPIIIGAFDHPILNHRNSQPDQPLARVKTVKFILMSNRSQHTKATNSVLIKHKFK
ncbi:hypothetical protein PPL_08904 [Heterostelium album PN500]|uniref:Uncharacterized protein n=1 Tax=Heterostelium pallidum (strain ATCC 26659 / Pp 5 / PN500) TaxID=670386 RepID=D3BK23_HETP5|nr:hypothetical protein PPL_08904 [Heterostelium album PN500]EFA78253.1 hypothetical protein PPL_08904 [Heterostelium album PN500]|eukprot:XP_020430378.1 hypothetical protein PPL_08904 [Heterostelium album PN500]